MDLGILTKEPTLIELIQDSLLVLAGSLVCASDGIKAHAFQALMTHSSSNDFHLGPWPPGEATFLLPVVAPVSTPTTSMVSSASFASSSMVAPAPRRH
jgi:hypothetical protein